MDNSTDKSQRGDSLDDTARTSSGLEAPADSDGIEALNLSFGRDVSSTLNIRQFIDNLRADPELLGAEQLKVARAWADRYASANGERAAEIVLRNPAHLSRELEALPEALQSEWHKLFDFVRAAIKRASLEEIKDSKSSDNSNSSPLDCLHALVFRDEIDPLFRRTIADIMVAGSRLFADSVIALSHNKNSKYYAENIGAASKWLSARSG